jgi:hypothetical protein
VEPIDEVTPSPGPITVGLRRPSFVGPRLENDASLFCSVPFPVAPTVRQFFAVAGALTDANTPMFPLAYAIR